MEQTKIVCAWTTARVQHDAHGEPVTMLGADWLGLMSSLSLSSEFTTCLFRPNCIANPSNGKYPCRIVI